MKTITAEEFDKKFDDDEDVSEYIDFSQSYKLGDEPRRVNVDFPAWMVSKLDKEAKHMGVPRQSLIKMWIAEKLKSVA